jgi:hypothetical protein
MATASGCSRPERVEGPGRAIKLGLTPGFFLGLQADHDLMARRRELGADLELIEPRAA